MAVGESEADLSALIPAIDRDGTLAVWEELCRADRILSSGEEIAVRPETLEAFVETLSEPYGFEEGIEELAQAAQDLLEHAGSGGLATRQLLALGEALARYEAHADLRPEYDRRLRVVLGRFVLYVNVSALREVDRQARRDALTSLHNRLAFDIETQRLHEKGVAFCVAFIDVDGLKQVNDTDGHEAGDELLRRVATALAEACAGGEYAYRFGGDEYAYLSTVRPAPDVQALMGGLSSEQTPFSWGVAHHPDDGQSIEEVIGLADQRMYDLKRSRKAVPAGFSIRRTAKRLWRCLQGAR